MKKIYLILIFSTIFLMFSFTNEVNTVKANELSDSIYDQLENIDLTELEYYFNTIENSGEYNFYDYINQMLNGKYSFDFTSLSTYICSILFNNVSSILPIFISIIAIGMFSGLMKSLRSKYFFESNGDLISFVCLLSIILLLSSQILSIYSSTKNTIENIAKLTEIMSPIILTLMIAGGGSRSAMIYKPAVAILSNGIINIFLSVIMPLVSLIIIFNILSNFSNEIKLNKFIDMINSIIKWIIGLIITIFGVFLTIQGITSAAYDGISIKATKYAISNSVPLIGSFLKDGFDLVVVGSVIIKNTIGVTSVIALLFTILSPVLYIAIFSIMLKTSSAILDTIADKRICAFCESMSKCISYLTVCILSVGLMLFITVILIMFSANAYF